MCIVLVSGRAFAQSDAPVRLDYQSSRCGGADAFVSEVRARSPRVRFAAPNESATRALVVHVDPRGAKMSGRIELREADGTTTERAVTGASCDDVISGLGLVAALALNPMASTSATNTNATGTNNTSNTTNNTSTSANTSTSTSTSTSTTTSTKSESEDDDAQTLAPSKRRWSVGAGADGEAVFGVSPNPLFAVPVFFEVTRALGEHVAVGGALRFERAGQSALDSSSGGADFTWTAGAVDFCVVGRAGRVRAHACVRSHFGVIDAHGEGVTPERSATRPWVDVSLALALRVRIVGPIFAELGGSAGIALVQDRFFLEPNQTVFQVQTFTGHVGAGLGFEIW